MGLAAAVQRESFNNICGFLRRLAIAPWAMASSFLYGFFLPFTVNLGRTILTARLNSLEDKLSRKGPRMSVEYNLFCHFPFKTFNWILYLCISFAAAGRNADQ
jgi:hypothetical protein